MTVSAIALAEKGLVPDFLLGVGIRRLLRDRLQHITLDSPDARAAARRALMEQLSTGPIAVATEEANEQHYTLPPAYFKTVLGPHLKYSSALYPTGKESLEQAEEAMLALTCERAGLANGQDILELGCGWGSLSLWMAKQYPDSRITSVSNSSLQRETIEALALERGVTNLQVITCDMNTFEPDGASFDRIVSVEMFEHMRNYPELMRRIATWLRADGSLFVHIFTHHETPYAFELNDGTDWMARHFFTGGMMPSHDLLPEFNHDLTIESLWKVNGTHYGKTLRAWLALHDANQASIITLFTSVYGKDAHRWFHRWRLFYLACAELFEFQNGNTWQVSHYRFRKPGSPALTE